MKRHLLAGLAVATAFGCSPRPSPSQPAGAVPATATATPPKRSSRWLCRPDQASDPCRSTDLAVTELGADGSRVDVPHVAAQSPNADCFYVYPTVDLELVPGNHEDLDDQRRVLATTLAQAARFTSTCALWVPLYRQVTLGTWLQPRAELERGLAIAFADIERAFLEYLAKAPPGRPIVLLGHSQGAEMVVRLLRRFFDHDAAMRRRLLLAMPIGGFVEVAPGSTTGGTFDTIPICSKPLETGCVVAYRSYRRDDVSEPEAGTRWAPSVGHENACVDPAALDANDAASNRGPRPLAGAYFPVKGELGRFLRGFDSPRASGVVLPAFYRASCERTPRGYGYLAVDTPAGDPRGEGPIPLDSPRFRIGKLGLHVLDLQLTQGDLLALVARRVARSTLKTP